MAKDEFVNIGTVRSVRRFVPGGERLMPMQNNGPAPSLLFASAAEPGKEQKKMKIEICDSIFVTFIFCLVESPTTLKGGVCRVRFTAIPAP